MLFSFNSRYLTKVELTFWKLKSFYSFSHFQKLKSNWAVKWHTVQCIHETVWGMLFHLIHLHKRKTYIKQLWCKCASISQLANFQLQACFSPQEFMRTESCGIRLTASLSPEQLQSFSAYQAQQSQILISYFQRCVNNDCNVGGKLSFEWWLSGDQIYMKIYFFFLFADPKNDPIYDSHIISSKLWVFGLLYPNAHSKLFAMQQN